MSIIQTIKKNSKAIIILIGGALFAIGGALLTMFFGRQVDISKKKEFDKKIDDMKREREKDHEIIDNSTYNDYDENGIRIRKKN